MSIFSTSERAHKATRDMNRVTGFAISLAPAEVHEATRDFYGETTKLQIAHQALYILRRFQKEKEWEWNTDAHMLLKTAIQDTHFITEKIIDTHPSHLTDEQLIAIAKHPETIRGVAGLAAHPGKMSQLFIGVGPPFYELAQDVPHVTTAQHILIAEEAHCPAAVMDGEVSPSPLFSRFVPWGMELAARSILSRQKDDE